MLWLNVFKHLLPTGRAWRLTVDKNLRSFFDGLSGAPADARTYIDDVYDDLGPDTTRELDAWEDQFALPSTQLTEAQRRARLDATWKALGGQSPRYIQDTLQAAGFDVYVHEWWTPSVAHPAGGSVNSDVNGPLLLDGSWILDGTFFLSGIKTPTPKNPFTYLWDGAAPRQYVGCGHAEAYCGGDLMFADSNSTPPGYPLVNKVLESVSTAVGCGHAEAYCGGDFAACGATIQTFRQKQYVIPNDPSLFPYFLYIGGETFPDQASVPLSRRDEFEDLCLKICPLEQWLGILVDYS